MSDKEFQKLLNRLAKANSAYKDLLAKAEEEYKRRFGEYPSDVDDDDWIDCFHAGISSMSLAEITERAAPGRNRLDWRCVAVRVRQHDWNKSFLTAGKDRL